MNVQKKKKMYTHDEDKWESMGHWDVE